MTRRAWELTAAAWLCGSLSACTHTLGGAAAGRTDGPERRVTELPAVELTEPGSPYHALPPVEAEKVQIRPTEERANFVPPPPLGPVGHPPQGTAQLGPPEAFEP